MSDLENFRHLPGVRKFLELGERLRQERLEDPFRQFERLAAGHGYSEAYRIVWGEPRFPTEWREFARELYKRGKGVNEIQRWVSLIPTYRRVTQSEVARAVSEEQRRKHSAARSRHYARNRERCLEYQREYKKRKRKANA